MQDGFSKRWSRGLVLFALVNLTILLWVIYAENKSTQAAPRVIFPTITLTPALSGLTEPVYLTHAGDNSNRIFIVEQTGKIRIYKNSGILSAPFLDLGASGANRITNAGPEQGLLSVAFPPNYALKNYFYVYYTNLIGTLVVARYRVTADPDVADPASEQIVLSIPHPGQLNHNGGQLQFGPDGYLYIGTGDGGSGGDPPNNAQNPNALLGKLLRINVEPPVGSTGSASLITGTFKIYLPLVITSASPPLTYTIPASNPYTQTVGYRGEIWALGVRNPWRFSFDRLTGDLYIGDVGQDTWEEIDFQAAASAGGENYGWRLLEGNHCYNPSVGCVAPSHYAAPVAEYAHGVNDSIGCSVTGGYVYRGPGSAALQGIYLYGDWCTGRIWGLQKDGASWVTQEITRTTNNISMFGQDQAGNLYLSNYYAGVIYQITSP